MMPTGSAAGGSVQRSGLRLVGASVILVLFLVSGVAAQTGGHGHVVSGVAVSECANGCPPTGTLYDQHWLIGGGFAYPLRKGRVWIAGDLTSRMVDGYLDASGGPTAVVGLGSLKGRRVELFAQGGPRWGDGGIRWNVGAGTHVWMNGRFGLRFEYQYQWENTTWGGGDTPPPPGSDILDDHLLRVGIAIR